MENIAERIAHGQWIWTDTKSASNTYADFYTSFQAEKGEAVLYLTADTAYEARCNGIPLASAQYPCWPQNKAVQTIALNLLPGQNVLQIRVFHVGIATSTYCPGTPGLAFAVFAADRCICASGPQTLCRICDAYDPAAPMVSSQLGFSFAYDAEKDGFFDRLSCPEDFHAAVVQQLPPDTRFMERPIPELLQKPPVQPQLVTQGVFQFSQRDGRPAEQMQSAMLGHRPLKAILEQEHGWFRLQEPQKADGIFLLLDLGRETAGYLQLEVETDAACDLFIGFGEHLHDLRVRTAIDDRNFTAVYHARKGKQQFCHPFLRLGCRYLMVYIAASHFKLTQLTLRPVEYPVKQERPEICQDGLLQKIVSVCADTLHLCMHDHYEDCPWREQAYYGMDSRTQMLCGYYAFQEYALPRASIRLAADGLRPDGLLELCAPASVSVNIPCFTLIWPVQLWEYVEHSGDLTLAEEERETLERILTMFVTRRKHGVQSNFIGPGYWNFYEWTKGMDGGTIARNKLIPETLDAPLTAYYIMALEAALRLSRRLHWQEHTDTLETLIQEARAAFHQVFFDEASGLYVSFRGTAADTGFSALTQSLAIVCGAVPESVQEGLLQKLADNSGMVPASFSSSLVRYQALLTRPDLYAAFTVAEIKEIWGTMLFQGATSFWETQLGEQDFDAAGSLCHGWSAVPLYILSAYGLDRPKEQ